MNGNDFNIELNYKVITVSENYKVLSGSDYSREMYMSVSMRFNKFTTFQLMYCQNMRSPWVGILN